MKVAGGEGKVQGFVASLLAPPGLTTGVVGDDFRPAPSQRVSRREFVPCSSVSPHIATLLPPVLRSFLRTVSHISSSHAKLEILFFFILQSQEFRLRLPCYFFFHMETPYFLIFHRFLSKVSVALFT